MGRAFEDGACQRWGVRAVCREGDTEPDCVMINSVSNQPMVSDMLNGYGHVYCFWTTVTWVGNDGGDQETVRGLNEQGGALPASQGSGQIPTAPHEEGGGNMHGAEIGKRVKNKKVIIRSGI